MSLILHISLILPMECHAVESRTTALCVSWWSSNQCNSRANLLSAEIQKQVVDGEVDWNVKVLRALWSSRRRDSCSRGLFWQRSPAVQNLQLYLVMSNHILDSAKFISWLRSWDVNREYCSEAKLFFLTTSKLLKSIYLHEKIDLFYRKKVHSGKKATFLNSKWEIQMQNEVACTAEAWGIICSRMKNKLSWGLFGICGAANKTKDWVIYCVLFLKN